MILEMLTIVHKARDKIVAKLASVPNPKPGVFLASPEELHHKKKEESKMSSSSASPLAKLDDDALKFLEQQNESNKVQLDFFMKSHERQDVNLKKKMEYALNCLRKREEIDKMYQLRQLFMQERRRTFKKT